MQTLTPSRLRCEYQHNPLGIDSELPRLSWLFETDRQGARQTAYQITALGAEGAPLWNSGRVESDESTWIPYGGPPLQSGDHVSWKVTVWDETGQQSQCREPAYFEMGLLAKEDWRAQWVAASVSGGPRTSSPAPFLRRAFTLAMKPVNARLYATALGLYECRINGAKVGDHWLAPGWTEYKKRVRYQTFDVTAMLSEGENVLGAVLGDGWYCGNVEWRGRELYGDRPWLLAQLQLTYSDGSTETLSTDESWKFALGPILEADLVMGESYDSRKEIPGWDLPGYSELGWQRVLVGDHSEVQLVASQGPPIRATQEIVPIEEPKKLPRWPNAEYLFDLGQNMVGVVRFKVKGPAGGTVRLRYGEVLDASGKLYTENLRSAKQTDYYTLRGDEQGEEWTPMFTFHGFRYVEISGKMDEPTRDAITGIVLHSDTSLTGTFECSDELVNQLQRNIDWGWRGNSLDVPTDCPQRDERLGWTGDAQVFVRTASFIRGVDGFFANWQQTLEDSQSLDGQIPCTAPNTGVVSTDGGPAWADAVVICPWTIYRCYGDKGILERHYDSIKRFIGFLEGSHKDYIRAFPGYEPFRGFGDWLSINAETPEDLIGTALLAYSVDLARQTAEVLDRKEDADHFANLLANVKRAFQRRYITPDGLLSPPSQTAYLLALQFGLMPEHSRASATQALVDDVAKRGWHLSAGFVGSSYMNHVLSENGRNDVAYKLLFQNSWPSWLYPVTQGATTIWERWDGWTHDKGFQDAGMNSFNHYAYGAIGSWLYQKVAGIDLHPTSAGYKHFVLKPYVGEGLTHACATFQSVHGLIESRWKIEDGSFEWHVRVPANCTAVAQLPLADNRQVVEGLDAPGVKPIGSTDDCRLLELTSGTFRFAVR